MDKNLVRQVRIVGTRRKARGELAYNMLRFDKLNILRVLRIIDMRAERYIID